jgi:SAM-dependent methyltransferase
VVTLAVELALMPDEARAALADELALAGLEGVEPKIEPVEGGTRVTLELRPDLELIGDGGRELAGWLVSLAARAASPEALGDWVTDRRARRPGGAWAREVYADPTYHWPNFLAILAELSLAPDDALLEVGCGGGAFLREALKSGCRAAGIDHSPDMVRLTRDANVEAIEAGRLEVVEGDAAALSFAEGTFTAAVMTGVLGFLPDPVAAFAEIRSVLAPGGRVVAFGSDPAMKGTPGAPEPMASRLRFYTDEELELIGRDAGFDDVQVVRIPLGDFAREAGLPDDVVVFFGGPGAPFLLASKH